MAGNIVVIITDPYNDLLHTKGKLNSLLVDIIKEIDMITHLKDMVNAARDNELLHHQMKPSFWQVGVMPHLCRRVRRRTWRLKKGAGAWISMSGWNRT